MGSGTYNSRGLAYGRKGDYDKAIADCTEAIRLDPKFAITYFNRGAAYENKGEHDKAIADYTEAIRLDPKDGLAYKHLGVICQRKGEEAKRLRRESEPAIKSEPDREGAPVVAFPITLGDAERILGATNQKNNDSILYSGTMKVTKTRDGIDIMFSPGDPKALFFAAGFFTSKLFTEKEGKDIVDFVDEIGKSRSIGRFNVEVSEASTPLGWRKISLTPVSPK